MVSRDGVIANNGAEAKSLLRWMLDHATLHGMNYYLGGAVSNIAWDATAVHNSVRSAVWNLCAAEATFAAKFEQTLPDNAGVCYNQCAGPTDPTTHAPRLLRGPSERSERLSSLSCDSVTATTTAL